MSNVYVSEPPTFGKVVLKTTHGDIDIELWSRECPKACRNFIQLCLEGYYDHTIFHRIVKKFLIQGGDPTGTGTGGSSIYENGFPEEFHSRLRFRHRGLVGVANAGKGSNSNGSQFFITLDKADALNNQMTLFGKVTGNSIFNLVTIGDLETDSFDRPLSPPKVLSTHVLVNPFDDIAPRNIVHAHQAARLPVVCSPPIKETSKEIPMKVKKKLLSFAEEEDEEEEDGAVMKSAHELLDDFKQKVKRKEESSVENHQGGVENLQVSVNTAKGEGDDRKVLLEKLEAMREKNKHLKQQLKADVKSEKAGEKETTHDFEKLKTKKSTEFTSKTSKSSVLAKLEEFKAKMTGKNQHGNLDASKRRKKLCGLDDQDNQNRSNDEDEDDSDWFTSALKFPVDSSNAQKNKDYHSIRYDENIGGS
eukprot:GDKJ01018146.1.p1 GENE.GDKJ01018146.1~~GDKJ01018146.1.p1  ORF type:complete len:419 (+),score=90.30 GDKJ01018146.1:36-1292(+)